MTTMVSVIIFCVAIELDLDCTYTIGEIKASQLKDSGDIWVLFLIIKFS